VAFLLFNLEDTDMSPDSMTRAAGGSTTAQPVRQHSVSRAGAVGPIVAAVGGREPAPVLAAARHIGAVTANRVVVVGAVEPPPAYLPAEAPMLLPPEYETEMQEARRSQLARQVREASGARSGWRTRVVMGDAAQVIAQQARAERSPLIIMGVGRHRPLDRLLSRETTLRTIRQSPCPVLAVGPSFNLTFDEVEIATDFSPACAWAAEAVMPLLTNGAVIHLVHVWQPIAVNEPHWRVIDENYERSLPEKFRRFRALLNAPPGIVVKDEVREGRTTERLLDFASSHHVDLIVAGRQGMNRFARIFVGSTTASLLRGATCSLLIAPEPSITERDRLERLLTGVAMVRSPESWTVQLDEFTRRNRGRQATVEVDDLDFGAQVLESGYGFEGASYDEHDEHVELMLSGAGDPLRHVTRSIGGDKWLAIGTDADGRDLALRIDHGAGQTLLTFTPRVR
jgi:nucleotide-binding universal stress UspA family protein